VGGFMLMTPRARPPDKVLTRLQTPDCSPINVSNRPARPLARRVNDYARVDRPLSNLVVRSTSRKVTSSIGDNVVRSRRTNRGALSPSRRAPTDHAHPCPRFSPRNGMQLILDVSPRSRARGRLGRQGFL